MNINQVIKYPVLSEKTYAQMQERKVYTLAVDLRTNKTEIKHVVELIFGVKVAKVNIMNYDKKPRRVGKFSGYTSRVKKAVITLSAGEINLFPDEAPVDSSSAASIVEAASASAPEEAGPSLVEQRAAAKIAERAKALAAKDDETASAAIETPELAVNQTKTSEVKAATRAIKAKTDVDQTQTSEVKAATRTIKAKTNVDQTQTSEVKAATRTIKAKTDVDQTKTSEVKAATRVVKPKAKDDEAKE